MFHGLVELLVFITPLGWGDRGKILLPSKQGMQSHFFMGMKASTPSSLFSADFRTYILSVATRTALSGVKLESIERRLMWTYASMLTLKWVYWGWDPS